MKNDRLSFYINLRGTSVSELVLLTLAIPSLFVAFAPQAKQSSDQNADPSILQQIVLAVVVTLVCMPPSPAVQGLVVGLCISAGILRFLTAPFIAAPSKAQRPSSTFFHHMYIASSKASLLIYTACAILAVDFPSFPRKYAKTTNIGHGKQSTHIHTHIHAYTSLSWFLDYSENISV